MLILYKKIYNNHKLSVTTYVCTCGKIERYYKSRSAYIIFMLPVLKPVSWTYFVFNLVALWEKQLIYLSTQWKNVFEINRLAFCVS